MQGEDYLILGRHQITKLDFPALKWMHLIWSRGQGDPSGGIRENDRGRCLICSDSNLWTGESGRELAAYKVSSPCSQLCITLITHRLGTSACHTLCIQPTADAQLLRLNWVGFYLWDSAGSFVVRSRSQTGELMISILLLACICRLLWFKVPDWRKVKWSWFDKILTSNWNSGGCSLIPKGYIQVKLEV